MASSAIGVTSVTSPCIDTVFRFIRELASPKGDFVIAGVVATVVLLVSDFHVFQQERLLTILHLKAGLRNHIWLSVRSNAASTCPCLNLTASAARIFDLKCLLARAVWNDWERKNTEH